MTTNPKDSDMTIQTQTPTSKKVDDVKDLLTDALGSLDLIAERELSSEKYQFSEIVSAPGVLQMAINGIQSGDLKTEAVKTDENEKTFLVKLRIRVGEYDKTTVHLVSASSPEEAEKLAIRDECHNGEDGLYEHNGWTYESDDSLAYAAYTISEIEDELEKAVLMKYLYF